MQIKILKQLENQNKIYKVGDIVEVKIDEGKIPVDKFWRQRFKDAVIDNCIEIINNKKKDLNDGK